MGARTVGVSVLCLVCCWACSPEGSPRGTDGGAPDSGVSETDSGVSETDSGADGGGGTDAGDTCRAGFENAGDTVGCNGSPPGPQPDNAYGGNCTGGEGPGTCTGENTSCLAGDGEPGICVLPCETTGDYYVTNGGCPTGSRCFNLGGTGSCFPDCDGPSDCSTDNCDEDNSCLSE